MKRNETNEVCANEVCAKNGCEREATEHVVNHDPKTGATSEADLCLRCVLLFLERDGVELRALEVPEEYLADALALVERLSATIH